MLYLAEMYLKIESSVAEKVLDWFGGKEGSFVVSLSVDGYPFSQTDAGITITLSFINLVHKVASSHHQYLLLGANCGETHPVVKSFLTDVISQISLIEIKSYTVCDKQVTFSLGFFPCDNKMLAELAGELSNSATYLTTFGNVQRKDLSLIGGRYGVTWTPWSYDKRIRDAWKVSDFKKKVTDRSKVTQFIARLKSRQEYVPLIGKYVDFATKPEPLHTKNNACQQLNKAIFKEAMALTDPKVLSKVTTVTDLPENAPLARYFTALKTQVKAGKLYQGVATVVC